MGPRLKTPIYVQHELSAKGNHWAFNDVFAPHHDETPSRVEGLTSTTVTESAALDKDIFCPYPDDEQPGISQHDQAFLDIMHWEVTVTNDGYIHLLLPFKL